MTPQPPVPETVCPCQPGEQWKAFRVGQLTGPVVDALSSHLDACPSCAALLEAQGDPPDQLLADLRQQPDGDDLDPQEVALAIAAVERLSPSRTDDYQRDQPGGGEVAEDRLGPYRLLELVGEGGMGRVYKAHDLLMNRTVAVKLISARRLGSAGAGDRFRREMQALARLDHPHIVRAFHADEVGDTLYLAMEYVEGTNLADLVKRQGPLPIVQACAYAAQVADALQHAHDLGLTHRDIKPGNLILARVQGEGHVKVLDFGLARLREQLPAQGGMTEMGQTLGTPEYMAPEQWEDAAGVDVRADLYSLGCTLYFLLTGQPPFPSKQYPSYQRLWQAHAHAPVPPLRQRRPETPEALEALVGRLLAKAPVDRFATPNEVCQALRPFAERPDHGSTPDSPVLETVPRSADPLAGAVPAERRRPRWPVWAALGGLLAVAVVGGLWLGHWGRPDAGPGADQPALQVRVWRPETGYQQLVEALPVRTGDELQVRLRVPAGLHVGLFSVNGRGRLALLHQFPPQGRASELTYPGPEDTRRLGAPAGTEVLLACGQSAGPVSEQEMQAAWDAEEVWPALDPPGRLLRLVPLRLVEEGERPRDFGEVRHRPDADTVPRRLERWRERLNDSYPFFEGLAFSHQDRKGQ
jgi:serine/threonine protein kinase